MEDGFLHSKHALKPASFVILGLARLAIEDLSEVLLLARNSYGFGALKLLRALYEHVVTAVYLMKHPDEAQDFSDRADVDTHKLLTHFRERGGDPTKWATEDQLQGRCRLPGREDALQEAIIVGEGQPEAARR